MQILNFHFSNSCVIFDVSKSAKSQSNVFNLGHANHRNEMSTFHFHSAHCATLQHPRAPHRSNPRVQICRVLATISILSIRMQISSRKSFCCFNSSMSRRTIQMTKDDFSLHRSSVAFPLFYISMEQEFNQLFQFLLLVGRSNHHR